MKIINKAKLVKIKELLEEAQELCIEAISIDDDELGSDVDVYDQVSDILNNIEEL